MSDNYDDDFKQILEDEDMDQETEREWFSRHVNEDLDDLTWGRKEFMREVWDPVTNETQWISERHALGLIASMATAFEFRLELQTKRQAGADVIEGLEAMGHPPQTLVLGDDAENLSEEQVKEMTNEAFGEFLSSSRTWDEESRLSALIRRVLSMCYLGELHAVGPEQWVEGMHALVHEMLHEIIESDLTDRTTPWAEGEDGEPGTAMFEHSVQRMDPEKLKATRDQVRGGLKDNAEGAAADPYMRSIAEQLDVDLSPERIVEAFDEIEERLEALSPEKRVMTLLQAMKRGQELESEDGSDES